MSQPQPPEVQDDQAARQLGQLHLAAEHLRGADALSELVETDIEGQPLAHRHFLELRRELGAARQLLAEIGSSCNSDLPRADFAAIAQSALRRIGTLRQHSLELATPAEMPIHGDPAPLAAALVTLAALLPAGDLRADLRQLSRGDRKPAQQALILSRGEAPPLEQFRPAFSLKDLRAAAGGHPGAVEALGCILLHGGEILASQGRGQAALAVLLPALSSGPVSGGADAALRESQLHGGETLLVVDDEDMIWDILSDHLQELGYTVILAENGLDAVETYQSNPGLFDLVILDMVMPKMGGREAFAEIRKFDPSARIIISSGFMAEGDAGDLIAAGACGFLRKPYRIADLARRIRQACDK